MPERLAERPSTPSVQLVAFMETQISIVAPGINNSGLRVMESLYRGNQRVYGSSSQITIDAITAITRSIAPNRYSLQPPSDRSSRKPTIIAAVTQTRIPMNRQLKGTIKTHRITKIGIKNSPAEMGFPILFSASTAYSRPLSRGNRCQ